jgi:hypothetical protein
LTRDPFFFKDSKNVSFVDNIMKTRGGMQAISGTLPGRVLGIHKYIKSDGSYDTIAVTTEGVFLGDFGSLSGVGGDSNIGPLGWIYLSSCTLFDAETVAGFTSGTDGTRTSTCTDVTAYYCSLLTPALTVKGYHAKQLLVPKDFDCSAGGAPGILAYKAPISADISRASKLRIRCCRTTGTVSAGDIMFVVSDAAALGLSAHYMAFNLPAMTANEWYDLEFAASDAVVGSCAFSALTDVASMGFRGKSTVTFPNIVTMYFEWAFVDDAYFAASEYVEFAEGTDDDGTYLFINGGDTLPLVWNGTALAVLTSMAGWTGLTNLATIGTIEVFYGSLVLGNIKISSTQYPKDVAYSVVGKFFDFTNSGYGHMALPDIGGAIVKAKKIGTKAILYSDDGISVAAYVGGDQQFTFDTVKLSNITPLGPMGVENLAGMHVVMCFDGVYLFDGSNNPVNLTKVDGCRVEKLYKDSVSIDYRKQCVCFYDDQGSSLFIILKTGPTSSRVLVLFNPMDPNIRAWSTYSFQDTLMCVGLYCNDTSLKWGSTILDTSGLGSAGGKVRWQDAKGTWGDYHKRKAALKPCFGMLSGIVNSFSDVIYDDNGEVIPFLADTADITVGGLNTSEVIRWMELEVHYRSDDPVNVQYSLDAGETWSLLGNLPAKSTIGKRTLYFDVCNPYIRLRFFTEGFVEIPHFKLWTTYGGL